jgi:alpha-glucuronidase
MERDEGPFQTQFSTKVMLIIEDATMNVKCRTPIKPLFLYI